LYAGAYSVCSPPGAANPCVQVVFPLPNGNAVVVLQPEVDAEGAVTVRSVGRGFGEAGFYFTVHNHQGQMWARYVKSLREEIRVYADGPDVRADHSLRLWGLPFLRLHYRLRRTAEVAAA